MEFIKRLDGLKSILAVLVILAAGAGWSVSQLTGYVAIKHAVEVNSQEREASKEEIKEIHDTLTDTSSKISEVDSELKQIVLAVNLSNKQLRRLQVTIEFNDLQHVKRLTNLTTTQRIKYCQLYKELNMPGDCDA